MRSLFESIKNKPAAIKNKPPLVESKIDWGWVARRPNDAVFDNCNITDVDLSKQGINGIDISNCELSGGSIEGSTFKGVTFKRKTQPAKG